MELNVCLDWNCIIALEKLEENEKENKKYVHKVLEALNRGDLKVAISVVHASENPRKGQEKDVQKFKDKIKQINSHIEILSSVTSLEMGFILGHGRLGNDDHTEIDSITKVHSSKTYNELISSSGDRKKLNNKVCDLHGFETALYHGYIFLTNDKGVLKIAECSQFRNDIMTPKDFCERYNFL